MLSLVLFLVAVASGPVPSELGALEIRTAPGAEVLWEGISLGETDANGHLLIERVPPGRYAVGVRKAGFRPTETSVEVGGGDTTRLSVPLERVPRPRPERRPEPEPRPSSPPVGPTPQPEEPPAAAAPEPAREELPPTPAEPDPLVEDEPESAAPAPVEVASGLSPALVGLIALVGGLGLFFVRRRRSLQPAHREAPARPFIPPDPKIVSSPEDDTGFIETLKEQERSLDDEEPGRRVRQPEIIDAEYIELFESHEE